MSVFLAGSGMFCVAVPALEHVGFLKAGQFLALPETGLLVTGLTLMLLTNVLHISIRVYKKDPFLIPHTISSLAVAVLAWEAGQRLGVLGIGWAYVLVAGGFTFPVSLFLAGKHRQSLGS